MKHIIDQHKLLKDIKESNTEACFLFGILVTMANDNLDDYSRQEFSEQFGTLGMEALENYSF